MPCPHVYPDGITLFLYFGTKALVPIPSLLWPLVTKTNDWTVFFLSALCPKVAQWSNQTTRLQMRTLDQAWRPSAVNTFNSLYATNSCLFNLFILLCVEELVIAWRATGRFFSGPTLLSFSLFTHDDLPTATALRIQNVFLSRQFGVEIPCFFARSLSLSLCPAPLRDSDRWRWLSSISWSALPLHIKTRQQSTVSRLKRFFLHNESRVYLTILQT